MMAASCADGSGEEKKTCALRYIAGASVAGLFLPALFGGLAQSSHRRETDSADGVRKYTASRCDWGSRDLPSVSTSETPSAVRSDMPQVDESTLTVTSSTIMTRHSHCGDASRALPSMSSTNRRRVAALKLSRSFGSAIGFALTSLQATAGSGAGPDGCADGSADGRAVARARRDAAGAGDAFPTGEGRSRTRAAGYAPRRSARVVVAFDLFRFPNSLVVATASSKWKAKGAARLIRRTRRERARPMADLIAVRDGGIRPLTVDALERWLRSDDVERDGAMSAQQWAQLWFVMETIALWEHDDAEDAEAKPTEEDARAASEGAAANANAAAAKLAHDAGGDDDDDDAEGTAKRPSPAERRMADEIRAILEAHAASTNGSDGDDLELAPGRTRGAARALRAGARRRWRHLRRARRRLGRRRRGRARVGPPRKG